MPSSQPLPPKESGLFKRVLKCYEQKQYKAGLKYAKQILSNPKFSEHGETLAMKGLTLSCLGRKEEAYEDARRGLKNDLKSHVCWHVYGLLQRSDRKYDEAIKCYRNALKLDKDNVQILRDLALLQIQMRDIDGFRETQYRLLPLRPGHKPSWLGYSVAHSLLKETDMAVHIMREFRKTQTGVSDYEISEMILYENRLLQESNKKRQALDQLRRHHAQIRDMLSFNEYKVDLLMAEGRNEEAAEVLAELIQRNPEKWEYYSQLEKALSLETPEERLAMYVNAAEDNPRATAPRRIPLTFTTGETFRRLASDYIRVAVHKGVPQLFNSLRTLYKNREKVAIIEDIVTGFLKSLKTISKFHESDSTMEAPTSYLWVLFFLARHYNELGDSVTALSYIDQAIEHTPTLIELYMIKAKILKHAGDLRAAAQQMDEARSMDTADRYVNCKAAKYYLRVNQVEKAEELCGMFTREGTSAVENLNDMQCMWFMTTAAQAYQRLGQWGEALKKCHEIERHFEEFLEDQFDFHAYCLRRGTLRTYCSMLNVEDTMKKHRFYGQSAQTAIQTYIHLHDHPMANEEVVKQEAGPDMSEQERKKMLSKQRKAAKKRQLEEQRQQQQQQKQQEKKDRDDSRDNDKKTDVKNSLDAAQLARAEDPLGQAAKFLSPLLALQPNNLNTHLLAYSLYSKKGKVLLMLRAIKNMLRINSSHPQVHCYLCDFALDVKKKMASMPETMHTVLKRELESALSGQEVIVYNDNFLTKHINSLEKRRAAAWVMYKIDPTKQSDCIRMVTCLDDGLEDRSVKMCADVLQDLVRGLYGECPQPIAEYKEKCHQLFPRATYFAPVITNDTFESANEKSAEASGSSPEACATVT